MKILLTGATGYIGSAVLTALIEAGHDVLALVRTADRGRSISEQGATVIVGDMRDRDTVSAYASEVDAVIATASPGDDTSASADTEFVDAVLAGVKPGSTFVRTGGVWVHGSGDDITEDSPVDAPSLVAWRPELDDRALAAPAVRSILIEPGVVYGHGGGIPNVVVGAAQTSEAAPALVLVGSGEQHWSTIHVDDLAQLYLAALEHGRAGERYLAVNGDNPTTREIGEVASRRLGLAGRVVAEDPADVIARLGAFGEALLLDQQATGAKSRRDLDWAPTRPSLLADIADGGYDR